uniref:Uncharacterized protein n=1 Tax=Arundo donax TaxID=35708 RepID=A0A0A9GVA3_ARUDO
MLGACTKRVRSAEPARGTQGRRPVPSLFPSSDSGQAKQVRFFREGQGRRRDQTRGLAGLGKASLESCSILLQGNYQRRHAP